MEKNFDKDHPCITHKIDSQLGKEIIKYTVGSLLGSGSFAKVYKLTNSDSQVFAGKMIQKISLIKSRFKQKLFNEIKIHKSLSHLNIVKYHSHFEDQNNLYIVMEYCHNNTLSELIKRRKRVTEIEAQFYIKQLLIGLKYLHSHLVLHRDLKLANLFLSENLQLKIGDFGLSAKLEFESERKRTLCGTPNYMAPEIIEGSIGHSYECDIWSVGVILYTLVCGKPPFETGDIKKTYYRIKSLIYSFPKTLDLSKEFKSLVASILVLDYSARPSIEEILTSPFFTKNLIPESLPCSLLAVPPSPAYLKQFLQTKGTRSSSQGNLTGVQVKNPRALSKDSKKNEEQVVHFSRYSEVEQGPSIWITKWVDFSHKYGLGFLLSNNWLGVLFNDKTRVLANFDGSDLRYFSDKRNLDQVDRLSIYKFPPELYKKVMLVSTFKNCLGVEEGKNIGEGLVVKNWIKTPHCSIFRMADKTVQVFFQDKSELVLVKSSKFIVYTDRQGEVYKDLIVNAVERGSSDLIKKMRYIKEALMKIIKVDI